MTISRRSFLKGLSAGTLSAGLNRYLPVGTTKVYAQGGAPKHLLIVDLEGGLDTLMAFPFVGATETLVNAGRGALALGTSDRFSINGAIGMHTSMNVLNSGPVATLLNNNTKFFTMAGIPGHKETGHEGARKVMSGLSPNIASASSGWIGRAKDSLSPYGCFGIRSSGLTFLPNKADKACLQLTSLESYKFNLAGFDTTEQTRFINASKSLLNAGKPSENPPLRADVDKVTSLLHDSLPVIDQVKAVSLTNANFSQSGGNNSSTYIFKDAAKIAIGRHNAGVSTITQIGRGGFDFHDHQLDATSGMPNLLKEVAYALSGYLREMITRGIQDQVTVLLTTEFGRSNKPNGGGTDHGYGFTAVVIGGSVQGGSGKTVYGELPDATALNQHFMPVTQDVRNVHYRLMEWMGIDPMSVVTDPSFSLDTSLSIF